MSNIVRAECEYCGEETLHINGMCSVCGDFYNGMPKQKIKKKKAGEDVYFEEESKNALRK